MIENPTKMVESHSALLDNAPKYIVGRYPKDNENYTSSSSLVRNVDILEANSWASWDEIDEDLLIGGAGLGTVTLDVVAVGMPVLLKTEPLLGHLFAIPEIIRTTKWYILYINCKWCFCKKNFDSCASDKDNASFWGKNFP